MLVPGLKRASAAGLTSEGAGSEAGLDAGVTVSVVVRLTPPYVAVIVTLVLPVTADVLTPKFALEAPPTTVTLVGTETTAVFALLSVTTAPPLGAPPVNVIVPCAVLPPTTEVGLTLTADRLAVVGGGVDAASAVNRREVEKEPATPAELKARTRQKSRCAGKPVTVACDTLTF
jgi:hypothetical protein